MGRGAEAHSAITDDNDLTPEAIDALMSGPVALWRPPPLPGVCPANYDHDNTEPGAEMSETKADRPHFCLPPWPDVRGWAMAGFFGLTFYLLRMIEANPELLANASFMQFGGAITTGGVLLVATNLFGGTKSGTEAQAKATDALQKMATGASPTVTAPTATTQTINVTTPVDPNAPVAPADPGGLDVPPTPETKP